MRNRNVRVPVAMVPRSSLVTPSTILGNWIYVPMNEGTGVNLADWGGQGHLPDGRFTLNGAGSGQWATAGWLTPDGTNHYDFIPWDDSATWAAFTDVSTLTGGLLIMYDLWIGQAPNANESVFSRNQTNATRGGYGVHLSSAGNISWVWRPSGGGSQQFATIRAISGATGKRLAMVHYLDIANVVSGSPDNYSCYHYVNGVAGTTSSCNGPLPTNAPSGTGTGFTLLAHNATASPSQIMNSSGTPSNSRIARFFMKRCLSDESSKIAAIAAEWAKQPELPVALTTLGA